MGHLRIADDELLWWRHFSRRRTALVLSLRDLQCSTERPVQKGGGRRVNPSSTVFVCAGPGGSAEFALLHDADVDAFRRAIRRRSDPRTG
jgi:hypothetical protein